jgi:hypothetical protein
LPSTREYLREPGKKFYSSLQNDIWVFVEKQVGYPGIDRSKSRLRNYLLQRNTDAGTVNELIGIITLCETALYAPFDREEDRELIVIKTEGLLKKIS